MTEDRALTLVEQGGHLAARSSPLDALATMSDSEFEARLAGLQKAQDRMAIIQRKIMKEDTDYGVIPGTAKPTLLKPGAEKLCKFWHLVPIFSQQTIIGDGVTTPSIRILSTCSLHLESEDGPIVAQGIGSANSWEKKYRYREAQRTCPSCGAAAIIKGKAEFGGGYLCWGKRGGCGAKYGDNDAAITGQQLGQVENPDPYDAENTLEKMSAKRAQVDATLRATATSGLFTQDTEDMDMGAAPAKTQEPTPRRTPPAQPAKAAADPYEELGFSDEPPAQAKPAGNDPKLLARWDALWREAAELGLKPEARPHPCSDADLTARGKALKAAIEDEKTRRHAAASEAEQEGALA